MSGVNSEIYHAMRAYDPAKAHEYYMRVRKLKGRISGSQDDSSGGSQGRKAAVSTGSHPKAPLNSSSTQSLHAQAEARVAALTQRLDHLKAVLAEMVKQAKARSGVVTPTKDSKSSTSSSTKSSGKSGSSTKSTAKEKRQAHDYYEKHKKDTPKKDPSTEAQIKALKDSIEEVQTKIRKIRADLKTSVQNARDQSTNKTAPNGR